jgi:catechol 2,3-dioxygenase-like lactoylglutathione lyase family enzyme
MGFRKDAAVMRIEHFALNVAEPVAMARWYGEHLGMRIVVGSNEPPYGHFLADCGGADGTIYVMIEIYHNPADAIPDYAAQPPARMHLAFTSADPAGDRDRLLAAGATHVEDVRLGDGGHIVTLRDPWGLPLQLVRRGAPPLP